MIRVLLGLAILLLLYESAARDLIVGTAIVAALALVLNNNATINAEFQRILKGS